VYCCCKPLAEMNREFRHGNRAQGITRAAFSLRAWRRIHLARRTIHTGRPHEAHRPGIGLSNTLETNSSAVRGATSFELVATPGTCGAPHRCRGTRSHDASYRLMAGRRRAGLRAHCSACWWPRDPGAQCVRRVQAAALRWNFGGADPPRSSADGCADARVRRLRIGRGGDWPPAPVPVVVFVTGPHAGATALKRGLRGARDRLRTQAVDDGSASRPRWTTGQSQPAPGAARRARQPPGDITKAPPSPCAIGRPLPFGALSRPGPGRPGGRHRVDRGGPI